MTDSNNPFRLAFWAGQIDARVPAVFRIALGLILLSDVLDRLRDLFTFMTDSGVVPRAAFSLGNLHWSIFALSGAPAPTAALFLFGVPISLALIAGYRTRVATVLAWAFVNSLMNRNPFVCDGGDAVLRLLLLWSVFADLGARFSLDCRLGRRASQVSVPALPVRCLQIQIAFIYLYTFLAKSGSTWHSGQAVLLVLKNPQWSRGLGPLIARWPLLCKGLTYGTLVLEAAFAPLVLSPWRTRATRALALALGTLLHLGIFFTIRVGIFSVIMPVSYLVYFMPEWLDRLELLVSGEIWTPSPSPAAPGWPSVLARARLALLALTFVPAIAVAIVDSRSPPPQLPRAVRQWIALFSLDQNWKMFSPDGPGANYRWAGPGVLSNGHPVDVVAAVAPELRTPVGFVYSRWHKFGNNLISQPERLLRGVGSYLCRRYNGDMPGPKLDHFELVLIGKRVDTNDPQEQATMLRQRCSADAAPAAQHVAHSPPAGVSSTGPAR